MGNSAKLIKGITTYGKYARHLPEEERREIYPEITYRNRDMHKKKYGHIPGLSKMIDDVYENFVLTSKVLPSMRSMQFAGKPIEVAPNRIFNCAYAPADHFKIFNETMFLLLGGTGMGYSVQYHHAAQLPVISPPTRSRRYLVADSIEGWADAVKALITAYLYGKTNPIFDLRDIREKGALLVTSGGKAPGPEPLRVCLLAVEKILIRKKAGDALAPIEIHDILCHIADAVLAGGIRRAAMISLFSMDDPHMLACKSNFKIQKWEHLVSDGPMNSAGEPVKKIQVHIDDSGKKFYDLDVVVDEPYYGVSKKTVYWVSEEDYARLESESTLPWYCFQPQRGRSNNSAVILRHRVKKRDFNKLWKKIKDSKCGEPGFVFTNNADWGVNPCVEIGLRPNQFCNLVEINKSNIVDQQDYNERAEAASFISTLQAGYTDFHYLRDVWKKTTEKEALIGVSGTGIASRAIEKLNKQEAAAIVVQTNIETAKLIGINPAARTTCIKPAGTTSIMLSDEELDEICPSGIHGAHDEYILRRMRFNKDESIYKFLEKEVPSLLEDDYFSPTTTGIVGIPMKAPKGCILRTETAIQLLERVKEMSVDWVSPGYISGDNGHNVSATISVRDEEWDEVSEWMWKNRQFYNGLSILPYDGGTYKQAPFEGISKVKYEELMTQVKDLDFTKIKETDDATDLSGEVACAGGLCEI
jgi:hypothetical protein